MKLVPFLLLALVACKSHKPAAKAAAGSAVVATPVAPAATPAPTAAPAAPYVAPTAPDDEVVPQQAVAGSAFAPAAHHDPVARQFDKLDTNHDGKLTPDEVKQHFPDDLDTNGDGEISKDELEVGMREKRIRARGSHVH